MASTKVVKLFPIWIADGRLREQEAHDGGKGLEKGENNLNRAKNAFEHAVRELRRHQVFLAREQWLKVAEECEKEGRMRPKAATSKDV